ncbi:MAG: SemiSWEET family sugar transporter [Flavobacteriales bacterium]|jgi:MtN3 and saliva related transmembrane protein|tara:strand:- start:179 stop:427 length:249 start_codon:yes stop_codon:yes gene_type:complete
MEWMGWIAALLTTISFVPQAIKVIQSRSTEAISLWMYILFTLGIAAWLAYGIHLNDMPMMIANVITLSLAIVILTVKVRNND